VSTALEVLAMLGNQDRNCGYFQPYDIIWEETFAVYNCCKGKFRLDEFQIPFKALTTLHTDGLSCTVRRSSDHSTLRAFDCNLIDEFCDASTSSHEAGFMFSEEALKMCELLKIHNFKVSEETVTNCLLRATKKTSASPSYANLNCRDEVDVSSKIDAIGDLSHMLNEAVSILDGKMGEDEVVSALADLVTQSSQLSGCVLIDRRDAQQFTKDIVEWIEEQLLERLRALDQSHSKVNVSEGSKLLNLIEKVSYLSIRTGYHFNHRTRVIIHSFTKKVWSELGNFQYADMFVNNYPFFMYKLIIWDNLDAAVHMFSLNVLSELFHQFKISLRAVINLAMNPLYETLEVVAMISRREKMSTDHHDELDSIKKLCIKMVVAGMHCEAMDDNQFAYSILEYSSSTQMCSDEAGPISLALRHEIGEFLCLQRPEDMLEYLWHGALGELVAERREPCMLDQLNASVLWNHPSLYLSAINLTTHRNCPVLIAYLEFFAWATFLSCVYVTIMYKNSMRNGYVSSFSSYNYALFVITAGFFIKEIQQAIHEGLSRYFSSMWNIQDALIIIVVVAFAVCKGSPDIPNEYAFQALAIASLFVLFRTLYFAVVFKSYGVLVTSLFIMVGDAMKFLVLFFIIIFGFAVVMASLFSDSSYFSDFPTASLYLFEAGMTAFDFRWLEGCRYQNGGVIVLAIYIIISAIVLLNMLIAILAETYGAMTAQTDMHSAVMRANFIHDFQACNHLPIPFNCIELCLSSIGSILNTKMRNRWSIVSEKCFNVLDFAITMLFIQPIMCVLDCHYILKMIVYTAAREMRRQLDQALYDAESLDKKHQARLRLKFYRCFIVLSCTSYYTIFSIAFLVGFVLSYFTRVILILVSPRSHVVGHIKHEFLRNKELDFSFREKGPIGRFHSSLLELKDAMLRYYDWQADDVDDLINNLDFNMGGISVQLEMEQAKNSATITEVEKSVMDKLSEEVKGLAQRIGNIEQENSRILSLLVKQRCEENSKQQRQWPGQSIFCNMVPGNYRKNLLQRDKEPNTH